VAGLRLRQRRAARVEVAARESRHHSDVRLHLQKDADPRRVILAREDPRLEQPHVFTLCCDPEWKAAISFKRVGPDVLALEGTVNGKQIRGRYRRMDDSRFLLISRGFHWINEWPMNR
jgi:hypothetical protein